MRNGRAALALCCLVLAQHARAELSFAEKLSDAAIERTRHQVLYDGSYHVIPYPGGDVPEHIGVCTDVIIRSYRKVGLDLQRAVHEDMKEHFHLYPKLWGLRKPDPNIDHRRVPNLRVFFSRHGEALPVSEDADAYKVGDIVTWNLSRRGSVPHIGIVTDKISDAGVPMVVHNIGAGPRLEDRLFAYEITGHYRYAAP